MMAETSGGARRMAILYHNQGIEKANKHDLIGAMEDLERALELLPGEESREAFTNIARIRSFDGRAEAF